MHKITQELKAFLSDKLKWEEFLKQEEENRLINFVRKAKKEKEAQPELPKVEKTTLGDLSILADLKASMAAEEKPKAKKATKKAAAEAPAEEKAE